MLDDPLVRRLYDGHAVDETFRLWGDREKFFRALNQLPQTFCHLDAVRRNLFVKKSGAVAGEFVAIDWAFSGIGALGQELAALIVGNALLYEVELGALADLESAAIDSYLAGLAEAGWHGDKRLVQLGYAASTALRFTMYGLVRLETLLDRTRHAWVERALGHSLVNFVDRVAAIREFALSRSEQARSLM